MPLATLREREEMRRPFDARKLTRVVSLKEDWQSATQVVGVRNTWLSAA